MPRELGCRLESAGEDAAEGLERLSAVSLHNGSGALSICAAFALCSAAQHPQQARSRHAGPVGCFLGMGRLKAETREGKHEDRKGWRSSVEGARVAPE